MKNEMSSVGTQLLHLPLQAAPIERTLRASGLKILEKIHRAKEAFAAFIIT